MSFIDFIKNLFNNGKTNTKIIAEDLIKIKGEGEPLQVSLTDKNNNPLNGKDVIIDIHNVPYTRKTDDDGIASLNINLGVGKYKPLITFEGDDEYNKSTAHCTVVVNPVLITNDVVMSYKDGTRFIAKLTDKDGHSVDGTVNFAVNGVNYEKTTSNGEASLALNLNPETYKIITTIAGISKENTITIKKQDTKMEGTDLTKTVSEKVTYQCAVYNKSNERVTGNVDITVNGVTYNKPIDEDGLAKLNINLNQVGNYTIQSTYKGNTIYNSSNVTNTVTVKADKVTPTPTPTPTPSLKGYLTNTGCSGMGQCNGYYCACNSLQQAFYRLTGILVAESTIAGWAGTTTSGTGHSGIETAVYQFNKKYGKNVKITWKNFSDLGSSQSARFTKLQEYMNKGAVFFHLLYRNQWGHYEVPYKVTGSNIQVLNSLGNSCGNGTYCGYIETRSQSTQVSYISGISQKSVAILTI